MLELLSLSEGTKPIKEIFLLHLYEGIDDPELKFIDSFIYSMRKKPIKAFNGDNRIATACRQGCIHQDPQPVIKINFSGLNVTRSKLN